MRGVPIAVFGSIFLLFSLLTLSEAHSNKPISDNIEAESNPRPTEEDKFAPRAIRGKTKTRGFIADRLKADGFLKDNHAESSLERDLTNKLKAIYERYYELSDKLEQAEGHSGELTKQLMQTKLDLANYKVYKTDLINRLKKTEMYLTVLLKKSQYHVEEHHIDLNPDVYEEVAEEISSFGKTEKKQDAESRSAAVTNSNIKEEIPAKETPKNEAAQRHSDTLKVDPNLDTKSQDVNVGLGNAEKTTNKTGDSDTPSTETSEILTERVTVIHDSQGNQTMNNGTRNDDVMAQIAFNFLRKKPSKPKTPEGPALRGGFFDEFMEDAGKSKLPTGPFVKNVTVVLRGAPKRKDVQGASLADWDFGSSLGNMGFRIFESDSGSHHHTKVEYRRGEPGSAGFPGLPGTPGVSGPAGLAGKDGTAGTAGGAGQKGEPGTGVAGVNGVNGVAGVPGAPGFPGTSGAPGATGIQGVKGSRGVQGPMGAKGIKGGVGAPGTG